MQWPGIILLSQPVLWSISREEMLSALSEEQRGLPLVEVQIDTSEAARAALLSKDWRAAQQAIDAQVTRLLLPHKETGYPIFYFGSAPIPLAVYLGFLVGTWWPLRVFQQHHQSRLWTPAPDAQAPVLRPVQWPTERDRSPGVALLRVSTSHCVEPRVTRALVPDPLLELDLSLEAPTEDAFSTHEQIEAFVTQAKRALDLISDQFLGVHTIHLFASVQTGVAFLLGAQIGKTKHPRIQTYHYHRSEQPSHSKAIVINGREVGAKAPLSADERETAQRDRELLVGGLQQIKTLAQRRGSNWVETLFDTAPSFQTRSWLCLPSLGETPIDRTQIDTITTEVEDSFSLEPQRNAWQLDERWLSFLARRLPRAEDRGCALRLLLLHEAIHRGPQRLTRTNSERIGRFSRIVEEMDYQADVWAILHEYAMESPTQHLRSFFMRVLQIATEATWAFDDRGPALEEIQARRLHRYLLWAWQYLLFEAEPEDMALGRALEILSQKPCLEVVGPEIVLRGDRVFFLLTAVKDPEFAVYQEGKLYRHGERSGFSIQALLEAIRARNGERLRGCLRGVFEQTVR